MADDARGKRKNGEESRRERKREKEGSRRKKNEVEIDEICYFCKDGGLLQLCDHKKCNKAYHPECVGKDNKFIKNGKSWFCNLHFCFGCPESPEFHCVCCPKAMCNHCFKPAEFVQIKGEKVFCSFCLKLALYVEENADEDSGGPLVDCFREFWKINSKRECLTLEDLRSVDARMKEGKCYVSSSDSDEHDQSLNDGKTSDSDIAYPMRKRQKRMKKESKGKAPMVQRNKIAKRKEFVGWGSKILIDFLKSIGVDVAQALPQKVVTAHIKEYARKNNLYHPQKKKHIICDANLQTVLGRKIVKESKVYDCLDCHFAENQLSSDEDATNFDLEEKDDDTVACNSPGNLDTDGTLERNKMMTGSSILPNQFASINPKNISLVYLRRGLVKKCMQKIETFDDKVVGSFVKFKTNPKERRFDNPHKLVQITGTTRTPTAENGFQILLKASGVEKDIRISVLSNGDVTEEECYELKVCIQEGVLKHPTVAELQRKAMDLHEDIVKHWISKELFILQQYIDQARERGWRKQLHEHLTRRECLQSSHEQEKLLNTIPQVIADEGGEIAPDLFCVDISGTSPHESEGDQVVIGGDSSRGIKNGSNNDDGPGQGNDQNIATTTGDQAIMDQDSSRGIEVGSDNDDRTREGNYYKSAEKVIEGAPATSICLRSYSEDIMGPTNININGLERDESSTAKDTEGHRRIEYDGPDEQLGAIVKSLRYGSHVPVTTQIQPTAPSRKSLRYGSHVPVTTQTQPTAPSRKLELVDPVNSLWYCIVSDGTVKGPLTLSLLRSYSDFDSACLKYKVWLASQSKETAITLGDALKQLS